MSVTFIEKIKTWIFYMSSTPVSVHGIRQELIAWAVIAGTIAVILAVGELIYRWEERRDDFYSKRDRRQNVRRKRSHRTQRSGHPAASHGRADAKNRRKGGK